MVSNKMSRSPFSNKVIELVRAIPEGQVCTYGRIAALAGNPRAARQVVRVLHSVGALEQLPWQRVINSKGGISPQAFDGHEEQRELLEEEGIEFDASGRVDLDRFLWRP